MLRASLLGLGVVTLGAAAVAIYGAGTVDAVSTPEPRPVYLALGGDVVDLAAARHGPGCFAPMLDELRRHPHWTLRIDDLVWDDVIDDEPDERRATLVIDADTATWRDGAQPQALALTADERRDVLAAFAFDCRVDETLPQGGFEGHYIGLALGEDGPLAAKMPTNSRVTVRLLALFDAIRARYLAGRADDLRGFSIELAGTWWADRDDRGRPIPQPHRATFRHADPGLDTSPYELEGHVRLLDWAMAQPASLPAGDHVVRGTLRAHASSRPIAIDLTKLDRSPGWSWFRELAEWLSIDRSRWLGDLDQ